MRTYSETLRPAFIALSLNILTVTAIVPNTDCPSTLPKFNLQSLNLTPSPFAFAFDNYIHSLGNTKWFASFAEHLPIYTQASYDLLKLAELDPPDLPDFPYPVDSLRRLYRYIVGKRLHCYARANDGPGQLLRALVTVNENHGTGKTSLMRALSDTSDDEDEDGYTASQGRRYGGMKPLDAQRSRQLRSRPATEIVEPSPIDPSTKFQFLNIDQINTLLGYVDGHVYQLEQLKRYARSYEKPEAQALDRAIDWWDDGAKEVLNRVLSLVAGAEHMLREPEGGVYTMEEAEDWLEKDEDVWKPSSRDINTTTNSFT